MSVILFSESVVVWNSRVFLYLRKLYCRTFSRIGSCPVLAFAISWTMLYAEIKKKKQVLSRHSTEADIFAVK